MIGNCIKSTPAVKRGREKRREEKWEEEGVAVIPSSSSSSFSVESNLWAEKKGRGPQKWGNGGACWNKRGGGAIKERKGVTIVSKARQGREYVPRMVRPQMIGQTRGGKVFLFLFFPYREKIKWGSHSGGGGLAA